VPIVVSISVNLCLRLNVSARDCAPERRPTSLESWTGGPAGGHRLAGGRLARPSERFGWSKKTVDPRLASVFLFLSAFFSRRGPRLLTLLRLGRCCGPLAKFGRPPRSGAFVNWANTKFSSACSLFLSANRSRTSAGMRDYADPVTVLWPAGTYTRAADVPLLQVDDILTGPSRGEITARGRATDTSFSRSPFECREN